MIAAEPENAKWRLEGVYASTNLGIVELEQARYAEAAETFQTSVGAMDLLISADPSNREYQQLLSEALAYHADALYYAGRLDMAIRQRERQLSLLAPALAQVRPDAEARQKAMIANRHLALLRYLRGQNDVAQSHARDAVELGRLLVELEPTNVDWLGRAAGTQLNQALILLRSGKFAEAGLVVEDACSKIDRLAARDPTVINWRESSRKCLGLRAELKLSSGSKSESLLLARQMLDAIRSDRARGANHHFALGQAHKLVGDIMWRTGDRARAIDAWRAGLATWPKGVPETPRQMAERGEMLRGVGRSAEGKRIQSQLAAKGYRQSLSNRARV